LFFAPFFGVVVGVASGLNNTTSVCKTLVTAFRAANSFLKNIESCPAFDIF